VSAKARGAWAYWTLFGALIGGTVDAGNANGKSRLIFSGELRGGAVLKRWFYGWFVVFAAFVVLTLSYSLQFGYGVFVPHISDDLDLGRAQVIAPFSIYIGLYALLSFMTGPLTDRIGPRALVICGGLLLGIAYGLLSRSTTEVELYVWLSVVAGIGMSAAFIPLNATVVKWFVRRRGVALAIAGTGVSSAILLGPVVAAALIPWLGWRDSLLAMALVSSGLIVLCGFLLVRDPEIMGLRPDGGATTTTTAAHPPPERSVPLSEARRTMPFWLLLCAFLASWATIFFPMAHIPSMMADLGESPGTGARLVGTIGVGAVVGRWIVGWVSDRVGSAASLMVCFGAQAAGQLTLAATGTLDILYFGALLLGLGTGSSTTVFPAILGDIFGRAYVGAIAGFMFGIAGTAAAIGPYFGGLIREATGSYAPAFAASAALSIIALILVGILLVRQRADTAD